MAESALLARYLPALREAARLGPILDLACGGGRNGLWLARQGLPVTCADIRPDALDQVRAAAADLALPVDTWLVDFEAGESRPLAGGQYGAILVFRYLHRPLMPDIAAAIVRGGLLVYETFTTDQPRFGRPTNRDFLLRPGELPGYFPGWKQLHSFEGVVRNPETGADMAIAQLVARRPPDAVKHSPAGTLPAQAPEESQ